MKVNKGVKLQWRAVKGVTAYFIWKNGNERVFKGKGTSILSLFKEIQLRSFEWCYRRSKKYALQWEKWIIYNLFKS